jgi:rod shape-determining protein MreD
VKTLIGWLDSLSSRQVIGGLTIAGALVLQTAVFPHLSLFGLRPDLLMVVVAAWGLVYGPGAGFLFGLSAGLAQDLFSGQYVGLFALSKALVGFLAGVVEGKIFKQTIWVPTAAIGVAVFLQEILVWICLRLLGARAPALDILTVGLPVALYSLAIAPLVYRQILLYHAGERARDKEITGGAGQAAARR